MKNLRTKIIITVFTFLIGVSSVAIWLIKSKPESKPDLTVYSANFCNLINEPNRFDGKIVRIQSIHNGLDIDTPASITDSDCNDWIRFTCVMDDDSCYQMNMKIRSIERGKARIDAVGRYTADIKDPDSASQNSRNVHLFEILELKGIETLE